MIEGSPAKRPASKRAPTLRDVAEHAGVSFKTVSNVINDYEYVSETTRAKVKRSIAELGYIPQNAARQLRTGASNIFTLSFPSLAFSYFSGLAQEIVDEAARQDLTIVLRNNSAGREEEMKVLTGFDHRLGDGFIFNPLLVGEQFIADLEEVRQPTVFIGEHVPTDRLPAGSDYVRIDNTRAFVELTDHVISRGRRRPAFLGSLPAPSANQPHGSMRLRLDGFRTSVATHGLSVQDAPVVAVDHWHRLDARRAVNRLLDSDGGIDAIVCGNDELALGVLAGLRDRGRRVPDDVAVVSYDDIPDAQFTSPALTSIRPDVLQIARESLSMLTERVRGFDGPPRTVTVPHYLIVRESSPPTVHLP
ncbi:LacI family DNA-binding transcriptional regulator [Brachybacterium sacelli]|uniref:DNA-binding LacI/PurR family transcriptional regulator n=1 Tax=Brachybacterium sacelli TaxID=173364 RepID=A0ABS4WWR9_9MICO|nr:LacI family DNA-binding transcriptional regulator [Brachybacterium sacelli]MBP2380652.1 DNA-binding LacI/PurR family transcriptional regulator [Brachybacterium sacelli]